MTSRTRRELKDTILNLRILALELQSELEHTRANRDAISARCGAALVANTALVALVCDHDREEALAIQATVVGAGSTSIGLT